MPLATPKSLGLKDDIEDILISLGRQYHILRPLRARPAVFYYVAVDRRHPMRSAHRIGVIPSHEGPR